jgi:predicted metalloprotease
VVSYDFYEPVKKFAEADGQPVSLVLGYVMAHEIGHLLGMKHNLTGIMKPHYDRRDLHDAGTGFLRFTAPDVKALRASAAN